MGIVVKIEVQQNDVGDDDGVNDWERVQDEDKEVYDDKVEDYYDDEIDNYVGKKRRKIRRSRRG